MIEFDTPTGNNTTPAISMKVLGIGGAGNNMVNSMLASHYDGIEFIIANTDSQTLKVSKIYHKIQLGIKATKGLGCGASPELGKRAAEEDIDRIVQLAKGTDVLFLVAGMGGGTGSGALPVIAHALKGADVLTIAIVTKPFMFEGKRRMRVAEQAIDALQNDVDTLLVVPNQKLLEVVDNSSSMIDAFEMINKLLGESVKSIADIISKPGLINVDFADLRAIMKDRGKAVMATGRASGNDRASQAALRAISSPLLENVNIEGARGVLLNVAGSSSLGIHEISAAASMIYETVHEDANIILGSVIDEELGDTIVVTVIATGFEHQKGVAHERETRISMGQAMLDRASEPTSKEKSPLLNKEHERKQPAASYHKEEAEESSVGYERDQQNARGSLKSTAVFDTKDLDSPAYLRKTKEKTAD